MTELYNRHKILLSIFSFLRRLTLYILLFPVLVCPSTCSFHSIVLDYNTEVYLYEETMVTDELLIVTGVLLFCLLHMSKIITLNS